MSELTDRLRGRRLDGMMHDHARRAADEIDRLETELAEAHTVVEISKAEVIRLQKLLAVSKTLNTPSDRRDGHNKKRF